MSRLSEMKRIEILRVLRDSESVLGSARITEQLAAKGQEISERTVRFHLLELDKDGLTDNLGKRGRRITERGLRELANAKVIDKVGMLAAKIDELTYQMDFNLPIRSGTVVVNMSLIAQVDLRQSVPLIQQVYAAGFAMGTLTALFAPGERVGNISVPEGMVGIGTVCSVTVNGVLIAHGIPTSSRFGGLLEVEDSEPSRFVDLIHYDGTTVDPLEVFIRSGMTDYAGAVATGNGLIGASFREVPAGSRGSVLELAGELKRVGLGAVSMVGWPGQPLLDIPVSEGRIGVIMIGGLNPVAMLAENGVIVHHAGALTGHVPYSQLFSYEELDTRAEELL